MAVRKQTVEAAADVKPEEATLAAALQAELAEKEAEIKALQEKLSLTNERLDESEPELDKAHARAVELEKLLEAGLAPGGVSDGETLTPEPAEEFAAGKNPPSDDAEVVAVKSRHGHAFWRAGYQVQPHFTFVRRADFEPADFARLIGDRMVEAREALPLEGGAE